jgi:hypothetical protein
LLFVVCCLLFVVVVVVYIYSKDSGLFTGIEPTGDQFKEITVFSHGFYHNLGNITVAFSLDPNVPYALRNYDSTATLPAFPDPTSRTLTTLSNGSPGTSYPIGSTIYASLRYSSTSSRDPAETVPLDQWHWTPFFPVAVSTPSASLSAFYLFIMLSLLFKLLFLFCCFAGFLFCFFEYAVLAGFC